MTLLKNIDQLDPKAFIIIKNARVNNLKNLSVAIPRNKLIVITGVSGSGKSSLAFDTLFAEGQRMYVESLSSYARQFLSRMEKPEVDYIKGISPAIAIEQKVNTSNKRSTVGTSTEIYDYLKLLFARIGKTISPVSGNEVKKDTVSDVVDFIFQQKIDAKIYILAPILLQEKRTLKKELEILIQKGFTRVFVNNEVKFIEDCIAEKIETDEIYIVIDRLKNAEKNDDLEFRLSDSVQTAFLEGYGEGIILVNEREKHLFSDKFELDGINFEIPSVNLFTFNNPYGACKTCEGFGQVLGLDYDLIFPNKSLSVYEGVIAPWNTEKMNEWLKPLLKNGIKFDFPIHRPFTDLSNDEIQLLWDGNEYFKGLNDFFKEVEQHLYKIQYRVLYSRYRGRTACPDCKGTRIRKDANYIKINQKSIADIVLMPIHVALEFFRNLHLENNELKIATRLLTEIKHRLDYLNQVGLGYLTLNRLSSTLSGGETQRINLATSLGSSLVGSLYILDEPSIGLHPKDAQQLVGVLKKLRDLGNTVIVVEHDEETMKAADQIIDIGPEAGTHGGQLNFQGNFSELISKNNLTLTGKYLRNELQIDVPKFRRKAINYIEIKGVSENNLKNIDVKIPLNALTVVTGVSGSGKSSLIKKVLYPVLAKQMGLSFTETTGKYSSINGSINAFESIEFIDQNPIGKSSRSNAVTYTKAYDEIRNLMIKQPIAKANNYKASHFSFNVDGGRCEVCNGEGYTTVEMQFMADIQLLCEGCQGKRFKDTILEVTYNGKNIAQILDLTIQESLTFFEKEKKILDKLEPLQEVGLGYIKLGQSSSTLSGGEAQRVKLATFLNKKSNNKNILFLFDEPSTGLHFHDVAKLMKSINALVNLGHSVVIIEHNLDIIKCADWIIDIGPEGGEKGGKLLFQGTPEGLINVKESYTGQFLKEKL